MSQRRLFCGRFIFDVIEAQKHRLREKLRGLPTARLADTELPKQLAEEYGFNVPTLNEDAKYARKREIQVDVSRDPMRYISDRSRPFYLAGTELKVFVPFTGDPGAFDIRPSSFDSNPPLADVVGSELCFTYTFVDAPGHLTNEIDRSIAQVKRYLDWLRPSSIQLQSELEQLARTLLDQRKTQVAAHAQAIDSLGIPIRSDENSGAVPRAAALGRLRSVRAERQDAGDSRAGWDVFVSHASEDREEIARPLAKALADKGLAVWFDEFSLRVGDSLRRSIDHGLLRSKFGVVILSPDFFEKHWPQQELNGLATRELGGKKVILPVWHKVGFEEVCQYSPTLADRMAVSTREGLEKVVEQIMAAMW